MTVETSALLQYAVLWELSSHYDSNGLPVVSSPTEIRVRWEKGLVESIDNQAAPIAIPVTVFVDRVIAVDSTLRLGRLEDVPLVPDKLFRVVEFKEIPDIKGRHFQRTVTLMRKTN